MQPLTAAVIVLGVLVVLLFAAGAGLYRRVRELELATYRGVGLSVGAALRDDALRDVASPGRTAVLIKINRRCPVCEELLAAVGRIAPGLTDDVRLVVLSDDPGFDRDLPGNVRVVKDPAAWRAVTVPYVPALLVVDERGTVVHTTPGGGADALERVVQQIALQRKEAGI